MPSERETAERIVTDSRTYLCLDFRFMTRAVMSMGIQVSEGTGRCSFDGSTLHFFSSTVVSDFEKDPNSVTRQIAHMILHLVLGHCRGTGRERRTAEDMIVEHALDVLDSVHTSIEYSEGRTYYFDRVLEKAGAPTADLFAEVLEKASEHQMSTYEKLFSPDDHPVLDAVDDGRWEEISKQMKVEIEGFSRNLGDRASALAEVLRIRNRRRTDHRRFLRRFMTSSEKVHVDPDNFDPAYYVLGLETYGNIPLIDPVEYSDMPVMEEFIIAVDTSGSTSGDLVRRFMEEIYTMMEQCGICSRTEIHLIQCDDAVREDRVIRTRSDMRDFVDGMALKGGGNTDFRPVFRYVDNLISEGTLKHPKGLIYFTDGMGTYPKNGPGYPVAFLFVDDRYRDRSVPGWAMKAVVGSADVVSDASGDETV